MSRLDLTQNQLSDELISLRHWTDDDLDQLVAVLQDPEISRWIPVIPSPYGDAEGRWFLDFADQERRDETGAHPAVTERSTGTLVGSMALTRISWVNRSAELGYWTARYARGRGVATRAARLVVRWAQEKLELERLELFCHPDNRPSRAVAGGAGFQQEGLLRGHIRVSEECQDSLIYGLVSVRLQGGVYGE